MWTTRKKLIITVLAIIAIALLGYTAIWQQTAAYYLRIGKEKLDMEDFDQAKTNLSKSLWFDVKNPTTHTYFGQAILGKRMPGEEEYLPDADKNDYQNAIEHYEKALGLGLRDKDFNLYGSVLEDLGLAYLNTEQYDKTIEVYKKKTEEFPQNSFWPRYVIANYYFARTNQPQEALEILLPALDSLNAPLHGLGRVYLLLSRLYIYFDNEDEFAKYAKLAEENAHYAIDKRDAAYQLAEVYWRQGDIDRAKKEIEKTGSVNSATNKCVLAKAYLFNKEYKQAVKLAEESSNQQSSTHDKARCERTLGRAYFNLGNKETAKNYFRAYLNSTDGLDWKNIFVIRDREEIKKILETL